MRWLKLTPTTIVCRSARTFFSVVATGPLTAPSRFLAVMLLVVAVASPAFGRYTLTTLASFNGTNGSSPYSGLTLSGSTLYGTTLDGGANGDGEVFSVPVAGGSPTVLTSFNSTNGSSPWAGVTLSGSTLYGTAAGGGPGGYGEVYSESTSGGSPTVLASFNGTNGNEPVAGVTLSGSTLYGTNLGGTNNAGEVYSESTSGGSPTVLASFNGTNGQYPNGVILSGSTLYGTTPQGGANGYGEVFSVPTAGGSPTVLASFNGTTGAGNPYNVVSNLTLSGTTVYGTTNFGGAYGDGEVFSLPLAGGTPTVLASFNNISDFEGDTPSALLLSGSTLYGTTYNGGAYGDGQVFSLPVSGGTLTVLASFDGIGTDGSGPNSAALIVDGSGNLYGMTIGGGADGDGTVFELSLPEPASLSLLTLAGPALLARRRLRDTSVRG